MKIKRYMAVSMRAALTQVRAEQGPDAVILSSRRVDDGMEVIAAVDYDEALFVDATLKRPPASAPEVAEAARVTPPETAAAARPAPGVAPTLPSAPPPELLDVRREIKELRDMLQGEFAHMSWNDKRLREPLQARVLEQLTAMDIAPDIAMSLASRAPRRTNL